MNRESDLPSRKAPVHLPVMDVADRTNIVFVTVCSEDRRRIFVTDNMHALIVQSWRISREWLVGRYTLLPDHIHFFCSPGKRDHEPLSRWMSRWKAFVSRESGEVVWQRSFWDRQLRAHESYSGKWNYVRNNPVRHRLVDDANSWRYQGELNVLRWHD